MTRRTLRPHALAWTPLVCGMALLAGCVTAPLGPTVAVMPGLGKTSAQYSADAGSCQQTAQAAIAGPTQNAQGGAAVTTAGGAVLGAAVGALFGAATGNVGAGAAWGAGTGLMIGGASAGGAGAASSYSLQNQYNAIYVQCMGQLGNAQPSRVVRRTYNNKAPAAPVAAPPAPAAPAGQFAVPPNALTPPPGTAPPQGYGSPAPG
jgi:hypothetical protein